MINEKKILDEISKELDKDVGSTDKEEIIWSEGYDAGLEFAKRVIKRNINGDTQNTEH